jgi:hypothetical protein
MFWPPPRHNKQRDRRKRLDSCYWVPHLSFKQKTSSLDSAFSRKSACKLLTFHWIFRSRFAPRFDLENLKKKSTPEKSIFSTHSEKSLLDPEPVGGLFKTKKSSTTREKCATTRNLRTWHKTFGAEPKLGRRTARCLAVAVGRHPPPPFASLPLHRHPSA